MLLSPRVQARMQKFPFPEAMAVPGSSPDHGADQTLLKTRVLLPHRHMPATVNCEERPWPRGTYKRTPASCLWG